MHADNPVSLADNRAELIHVIQRVLEQAGRLGADAAEAAVNAGVSVLGWFLAAVDWEDVETYQY